MLARGRNDRPTDQPTDQRMGRLAGFRRWMAEENDPSRPFASAIEGMLVRSISDPVLWVVTLGPAITQFTVAIVAKSAPSLSPRVTSMISDPVFCGLLSYSTTVFVAFVSWVVQMFLFAGGAYVWVTTYKKTASPGRTTRATIHIVAFVVLLFLGLQLFVLGRAGNEIMMYQGAQCYQVGGGFDFPPMGSWLTWLRFGVVAYAILNAALVLSPRDWTNKE